MARTKEPLRCVDTVSLEKNRQRAERRKKGWRKAMQKKETFKNLGWPVSEEYPLHRLSKGYNFVYSAKTNAKKMPAWARWNKSLCPSLKDTKKAYEGKYKRLYTVEYNMTHPAEQEDISA